MPDDEIDGDEIIDVGTSGDFETDLRALLGVDPEAIEDGLEEPEQDS